MQQRPYPSAEYELISRIQSVLGGASGVYYQTGIGDDAAVRCDANGSRLIITTDVSVENVHFSRLYMSMREIGYRAMVSNVSDCAAMGAIPDSAFVQLVIPADAVGAPEAVEDLYRGFGEACSRWNFPIAGGDLSKGREWVVGITLIGRVADGGRVILRKGMLVGDRVWVSGCPGRSAAGLALLQARGRDGIIPRYRELADAHIRPYPRVELGQMLAADPEVHAMMDLSDGLSKDCRTLGYENGCGMLLRCDTSLISGEMIQLSRDLSITWQEWFFHGGEDYELLFAASPQFDPARYVQVDGNCRLQCVGECTSGTDLLVEDNGVVSVLAKNAYDHIGALLQQAERTAILRTSPGTAPGATGG